MTPRSLENMMAHPKLRINGRTALVDNEKGIKDTEMWAS